ncbi:VWA domain-containing protein [Acuticoccus sp. I52.16.1]|uniref:vWA domain-containing protein n=1 Tax=Acuticoccus sp. I52.16.1 TaxID=2928472 RepID=UPI001FD4141C|nr:VWA domain-containing protein [Acuticoccus sp. I52.16.1]UOM34953.1 VWA domain-containing protein [Acuticoccus sp. I52.16.1]
MNDTAPAPTAPAEPAAGRLAENIAVFARVLRDSGLPVGPAHAVDAVRAVEAAGIASRTDVYAALRAVFVHKRDEIAVFDAAFDAFFRGRNMLDKMMELLSPVVDERRAAEKPRAAAARVAQALKPPQRNEQRERPQEMEVDARLTSSNREILRTKDFAQMSAAELEVARRVIARLAFDADRVTTRRRVAASRGRFDPRRSMRSAMRTGGELITPRLTTRAVKPPPIVALCDISGSMADYSRVMLHFLHALGERRRVSTFLFGTRLTNVTRALTRRDPDEALSMCTGQVADWSGGTRIGEALERFNREWSRRVLSGGPIVLLVTDGLERDGDLARLAREADRLHRSCRQLVFLNPLLRFDAFEPRAQGIRTLLPHVDAMRPIHSVESVADLAAALTAQR